MPRRADPLKGITAKLGNSDYAKKQAAYMRGVLRGDIVAGDAIKKCIERAIRDHRKPPTGLSGERYQFSPERADHFCRFFEFLPQPGGSGTLTLAPWQLMLRELFGWVHYDSANDEWRRRFTYAIMSMGRKCGKTGTAAVVALYVWNYEPLDLKCEAGQASNDGYFAAAHLKQAYIAFNRAREMSKRSSLKKFGINVGKHSIDLTGDYIGELRPVARDVGGSLDGLNPGVAIIDELAAHPTNDVLRAMRQGQSSRPQPLLLIISTAGKNMASPMKEEQEAMELVLAGKAVKNDSFGLIYTLDDGDDWFDESVWPKSLPALGEPYFNLPFIRELAEEAKIKTSAVYDFQCKTMNVWGTKVGGFFDIPKLEECGKIHPRFTFGDLDPDEPTYIGLDIGSTNDLTGVSAVQVERDGAGIIGMRVATTCFIPEHHLSQANGAQGQFYRQMRDTKTPDLIVTRGEGLDRDALRSFLFELCDGKAYGLKNIIGIGADPTLGHGLIDDLNAAFPSQTFAKLAQYSTVLTEPLKAMEWAIIKRRFTWSGSAFLQWQYANLVADEKETSNSKLLKPGKPNDKSKIDGVASALNALVLAIADSKPKKKAILIDLGAK